MSKTIHLNNTLLTAINRIAAAGYSVTVESGESGDSCSVVYITIGIRRNDEISITTNMRIKYIRSHGSFEDFIGMDGELGDLSHWYLKDVGPFLAFIKRTIPQSEELS
jgi:hypothetical protein